MTGTIAVSGSVSARDIALVKAVVAGIVPELRDQFQTEIEPLRAENATLAAENKALADRIAALEAREMPILTGYCSADDAALLVADGIAAAIADLPAPEKGEPGEVDMEAVAWLIDSAVTEKMATIPPVEPLAPDMGTVREMVDEMTQQAVSEQLAEAVKALPPPEKGEPGEVDMDEVGRRIEMAVNLAVAALPAPKDGERGKDGLGLANALIDRDGHLVVTFTDGSDKSLGPVVGKDGLNGKDTPPFSLDDFDIEQYPDRRTFKFCFTHGEVMHSFEFALPTPIYRGVFKEGERYEIGDMVTWGGSVWHADKDTSGKPDSGDWTLAVKRGRDAK